MNMRRGNPRPQQRQPATGHANGNRQRQTAHVWMHGKGGELAPGRAVVLLPPKKGETKNSSVAYIAPLRQALMDDNPGHVKVVVCESDYHALKRGIEHLPPMVQ